MSIQYDESLDIERDSLLVIFLSSGIPKCQLNLLSVNLDIGNVVLKHSGDVDLTCGMKGSATSLGKPSEQTCLGEHAL